MGMASKQPLRGGKHRRFATAMRMLAGWVMFMASPGLVLAMDVSGEELESPTAELVPTEMSQPPPTEMPQPPPVETPVVDSPTEAPIPESSSESLIPESPETPTAPTAVPTPTETPTPVPTATLAATPPPAVPFRPDVQCRRLDGGAAPVSGEREPGWLACLISWSTSQMHDVQLDVIPRESGWQVIAVNANAFDNPSVRAAATNHVALQDSDPDDSGFFTAQVYLGSWVRCNAVPGNSFDLVLTATSYPDDRSAVTEQQTRAITESSLSAPIPEVSVQAISFSPITDSLTGDRHSAGSLTLWVDRAPARCGWYATIAFSDFSSGDYAIPAANLVATGVSGNFTVSVTTDGGVITVLMPPGADPIPSSGPITIALDLALEGFVPQGSYSTTVTVAASAWS